MAPKERTHSERSALKVLQLISENPELSKHAVVREAALPMIDGLGKTQRNEKIKAGEYPQPFKISPSGRAKAWFLAEILAWQEERRRVRDEKVAAASKPGAA